MRLLSADPSSAPGGGAAAPSPLLTTLLGMPTAWGALLFFSLVINLLMLTPSIFMMQIYDRILTSRNLTTLVMMSLVVILAYLAMGALEWARTRIAVPVSVAFDHALGKRLLDASHRLSLEQNGGSNKQLMVDLTNVRQFITGQAVYALADVPWVPIYFIVIMMLHPVLGMVGLVAGCLLLFLTWLTESMTREPLKRANERANEATRFATLNLRNSEVIEAMGMLDSMTRRWQDRQDEHLTEQARASERAGAIGALTRFLRAAQQSIILGVGAYLYLQGELSPGAMIAASILSGRMLAPIEQLIQTWKQWGGAQDAWQRIDKVLRMPPRHYSSVALPPPKGEISLEGLVGGAPGVDPPLIRGINLKVPAGLSVAIIGASASGKSTLMRLMAGVWLPRGGVVRIDGADMQQWRRQAIGPYIGYLPQDVELLEGSVAENIARHGDIDNTKVIEAAQAAGVHEMVLQLPKGYDTQVGVGGAYLSGGQRQRIALARALYGNPPLLFLDEPNANLDEAGELALDKALASARQKKQTVVVVSHRPAAIRHCDAIAVMQAGQVVIFGPRDQVLAKVFSGASPTTQAAPPAPQPVPSAAAVASPGAAPPTAVADAAHAG
ncbi:MAG: type I secretion system permease/ATPase [Rhodocyclaceae bacterium]|nr:type I secretion system permease/ATPase [Rhodocyclaceae bacterium]MDZ4215272.1 type I secretion system permease/ATPase [Rhodocyclaceae bacterium]